MNEQNNLDKRVHRSMNRLAKWRSVFAGWQLGTRPLGDPECDAVRDHREATLILRAEVTALTKLLIDAQVFTEGEHAKALADEAELLSKDMERKFPGMRATDEGIQYDKRAVQTMKNWKP